MDRDTIEARLAELRPDGRPFIGGRRQSPTTDHWLQKKSPVDGRLLPPLAACGATEIDQAVAEAERCRRSPEWQAMDLPARKQALLRLADLMEEAHLTLALLDTIETGRSFRNYFHDSIPKAITATRYFAEALDKLYDHAIPPRGTDSGLIVRQPLGVVGLITPWNDPLVVAMWKLAPALAMGNCVVAKPAEQSSYSLLKVAELATTAGFPPGAVNVVTGRGEEAGRALALHPRVRGIYFTGSSATGKKILEYAGRSNMKRVGLECGGKSAYIVSRNCNQLEHAADELARNMFYNQGQICSAPSRVLVEEAVLEPFLDHLVARLDRYTPHHPLDPDTLVGCQVSHEQQQKVERYLESGRRCARRIWQAQPPQDMPAEAIYTLPTLFLIDRPDCDIWREEIFGPVLTLMAVPDLDTAVALANDSEYGLAAAIWTDDFDEAHWVAQALEAGLVHINSYGDDDNSAPFGGIKASGIGKDKSLFAFDEYSYQKTIWQRHRRPA